MLTDKGPTFYFVGLTGIRVGDKPLSIPDSFFSKGGTIVDSCRVISRLPATAYAAVVGVHRRHGGVRFQEGVGALHRGDAPMVSLVFQGCAGLDVDASGIMFPVTQAHV
jgi:hypothetical protein